MTKGMISALAVGLFAVGAIPAADLALAQSSAKELMGKAQTKSNTQAVEDLIKKLQGPKAPEAAASPPSAVAPAPTPTPATQEAAKPAEPKPGAAEPLPKTTKGPEPKVATPQPSSSPPAEKQPSTPPPTKEAKTTPPQPSITTPDGSSVSAEVVVDKANRNELPSADLEVYFDYKSAAVTPAATEVLNTLGSALADGRLAGDKFLIAGHTDARGGAASNLALSQRRAESVRAYLIETFKIDPNKLEAKGFGEAKLKNTAEPNADENRRVQVINLSSAEAQR